MVVPLVRVEVPLVLVEVLVRVEVLLVRVEVAPERVLVDDEVRFTVVVRPEASVCRIVVRVVPLLLTRVSTVVEGWRVVEPERVEVPLVALEVVVLEVASVRAVVVAAVRLVV